MAAPTPTSTDTPAPKDAPLRESNGKFAPTDARRVMGSGGPDEWDLTDAPMPIDPETDPLLSALPGKDLPAFGFNPAPDGDEVPPNKPAGKSTPAGDSAEDTSTESDAESTDEGGEQDEEGDAFLAGLAASSLGATEAGDGEDLESGSGRAKEGSSAGGDDAALMATIRKIGAKNPDLAAQVVREMFAVDGGGGTPPAATKAKAQGKDLRSVWREAVNSGKDFDGIVEIVKETVREALAPLAEKETARSQQEQFLRAKVKEFEVFKQKYPGWTAHRQRMAAVLETLSKDLGAEAAAKINPERLLYLAAPEFARESVKAAAAKAAQSKKVAASGRMAPPASQKDGGTPGGKKAPSRDQDVVNRTVQRLAREGAMRNFI